MSLSIYHRQGKAIEVVKWRLSALHWCSHLSESELQLSPNVASGLPLPLSNKLPRLRLLSSELVPEEGTLPLKITPLASYEHFF